MTTENFEGFKDQYGDELSHACLIEYEVISGHKERGVMVLLGEPISPKWRSNDWIVFWSNGDYTVPPNEFDVILDNLFKKGGSQ